MWKFDALVFQSKRLRVFGFLESQVTELRYPWLQVGLQATGEVVVYAQSTMRVVGVRSKNLSNSGHQKQVQLTNHQQPAQLSCL